MSALCGWALVAATATTLAVASDVDQAHAAERLVYYAVDADRDYAFGIARRDVVSGTSAVVVPEGTGSYGLPRVSPDGTRLVAYFLEEPEAADAIYGLVVMNSDGSGITDLASGLTDPRAGCWSPDSASFVFSSGDRILTVPRAGGEPTQVPGIDGSSPCYSPDGSQIVYAASDGLRIAPAAGGSSRALGVAGGYPRWSPDGTTISYQTSVPASYDFVVGLVDVDGSHARVLDASRSSSPDLAPAWSADGAWLYYTDRPLENYAGQERILRVSPDGLPVQPFTNGTAHERHADEGFPTAPSAPPAGVEAVSATPAAGAAVISWTPPSGGGVGSYEVSVEPGGILRSMERASTSTRVAGLLNGTQHSVQVRAVNAAGAGPWSAAVTVTPDGCGGTRFSDVATGGFCPQIGWMVGQRISGGTVMPDGEVLYRPVAAVSRQAMAPFLYRAAGSPAFSPPAEPSFADVATSHPFYAEIEWMWARGISTGTAQPDGKPLYKPVDPVSRQAMARFLHRAAGSPPFTAPAEPTFADVATTHPFYAEIEWMSAEGISTGTPQPDGKPLYKPVDPVSRQAMAAFLQRAYT